MQLALLSVRRDAATDLTAVYLPGSTSRSTRSSATDRSDVSSAPPRSSRGWRRSRAYYVALDGCSRRCCAGRGRNRHPRHRAGKRWRRRRCASVMGGSPVTRRESVRQCDGRRADGALRAGRADEPGLAERAADRALRLPVRARYPVRHVETYGVPSALRCRAGQPLDQEMIDRLRSLGYVRSAKAEVERRSGFEPDGTHVLSPRQAPHRGITVAASRIFTMSTPMNG